MVFCPPALIFVCSQTGDLGHSQEHQGQGTLIAILDLMLIMVITLILSLPVKCKNLVSHCVGILPSSLVQQK